MSENSETEVELKANANGNKDVASELNCQIHFANIQNRVYYAGDVLSGSINLKLNRAITVNSIYANVIGRGYCKWTTTTSSGSSRRRTTKTHMKEEFYLNRKIYYIGKENTSDRVTFQPGDYKYLFNCDIPNECHTSVEENIGYIRYNVIVVVNIDADTKKEFEEPFTVINELNLNDDKTFSYPMREEIEQTFSKYCCLLCCWETDPVKIIARIPMKAYAPGQDIEITIIVDNKSDQTFINFNANIFRKTEFYADDKTKSTTESLTTANCNGCPAGESVSRLLRIKVPPTPRTEASNIYSVSYTLKVTAFADCCRDDPILEFPLTIGTYPIQLINTQTSGIVITQQPTEAILNENEFLEQKINESIQSQPLLSKERSSDPNLMPNMSSTTMDLPVCHGGESSRSDQYPVFRFPTPCQLKVETVDVKALKM